MSLLTGLELVSAYLRARRLDGLRDRAAIEAHQHRDLARLRRFVVAHSPYYRSLEHVPFEQWPIVDKSTWTGRFDELNTVGARSAEIGAIALRHEETRDFSPTWRGLTVGLSTGTSGNRGLFLVSPAERAQWAGTLFGKLLRSSLWARERVALVLRAGSNLYDTIDALRLRFRFFDQAQQWDRTVSSLLEFDPTILVAPARVLRMLADSGAALSPRRVISVAEVLDELDRDRIEKGFGVRVEQIYQATEGLLGMSCERGTVHLNEPGILVEHEWLDSQRTRFTPIMTDLRRRTQPVIRYRLNDVLHVALEPCPCGRAALALAGIEGRTDDILWLDGARSAVPVFPDLLARAVVSAAPSIEDYEIVETERGRWRIGLRPLPDTEIQRRVSGNCLALAARLGAHGPQVELVALAPSGLSGKQRRVRGQGVLACAS